jgi:hypothetical protein
MDRAYQVYSSLSTGLAPVAWDIGLSVLCLGETRPDLFGQGANCVLRLCTGAGVTRCSRGSEFL